MKKLATLLVLLTGFVLSARAQTTCNASLTYVQTPNSYSVTFTNTSTVVPAVPSSPFAGTARFVMINGQYYNSNPTYTHTFPGPGSYPVAAYVSYLDSVNGLAVNCMDTTQYTVIVTQQPCAVSITSVTGTGMSRAFTANGGSPATGTTYTWDFGDGSPGAAGVSIMHTYGSPGTYIVTVTATGGGCTSTATVTVIVFASTPISCANVNTGFNVSGTGSTRVFMPTATPTNFPRTHLWSFGNGSTATTSGSGPATAVYTTPGTYYACVLTTWTDTANNITCTDTACQTITITSGGGPFNCANASSTFTASVQNGFAWLQPSITPSNSAGITISNSWNFGDGSTGTTTGTGGLYHNYSQSGTYTICLVTRWLQAGTTTVLCADTTCQTLVVTTPNVIYGYVAVDSLPIQQPDTFMVWLISYNASTSMLTAVDSATVYGQGGASFQFAGKPAGIYRTKAHKLHQAANAFGYVPTYRDSSLTWSSAQTFNHNNGTTYSGAIYLRQGLVTSGPGFVGGSVLSGANKATADGDPVANQLVFLRDAVSGSLVQSTYTNGAGQYSFSNLPLGSYTVYPEEMNYTTTPSAPLTLTASSASVSGILFKKDDVDMDIRQVTASVRTLAAGAIAFTLTPNPTSGKLTLAVAGQKAGAADVRVLSVTGQVVYSSSVITAHTSTLDLSHLPAGVYSVSVITESGAGTERVVIAR